MSLVKPTIMLNKITDITPELLKKLDVGYLLLDVDNTLASYISHEPIEGAVQWAADMQNKGFKLVIVSNNYKKRVKPFAEKFGLDYISFAIKPLPYGYLRASKMLGVKPRECAIVGDQVFTDIVGANMCGMKSILLEPVELEAGFPIRIRRIFEKNIRLKYKERDKI